MLSEGTETFIKKTSSRVEGGLPKVLDYGPHDVSFRNVAHISAGRWYQLCLSMVRRGGGGDQQRQPNFGASLKPPLLLCKCRPVIDTFGARFEFEANARFDSQDMERQGDDEDGWVNDDRSGEKTTDDEQETSAESDAGLAYGLISRLYFYY